MSGGVPFTPLSFEISPRSAFRATARMYRRSSGPCITRTATRMTIGTGTIGHYVKNAAALNGDDARQTLTCFTAFRIERRVVAWQFQHRDAEFII